ncbi:5-dehydro-4-deoxy-D-glucuronate isomerase [Mariniphaga sediminis]|jgi:4-deoxy-L-threo-5-hexosulose-uronate ketol-isomerase|uniref:4-deoxy-L-threo-5-hexosulose-uronate ketol-isomerase n=1 Tax=Mariniphaga sediminis TaxID=1628158 RepID=A0A399CX33_9BACT|nr:5-dehydro-4-deoxy-D-glucuronate isomerase [Mariniphaga sediminis]RIH63528.1 5-dehydro-4-deoxy-D-glucuronate isomerase [Mariniphaga sediminis]
MATIYEERYAYHPEDVKAYDTERIRKEFLVEKVMDPGNIRLVYTAIERFIVGGAVPVDKPLKLESIDPLKAEYFCFRREMGVINVAGAGSIVVDGTEYKMNFKDALYIGKGSKEVEFRSDDPEKPAHFYINSAPAHKEFPVKHITLADATVLHKGALETANERNINQLLISDVVDTCQLQMGMTELMPGSVWNTMPAHQHNRRNEVYFYFNLEEGQAVCHFMGQPQETRHIWMHNEQAVISPNWSIHAGAGTGNYIFIWGMAGENLDYTDMDHITPTELR